MVEQLIVLTLRITNVDGSSADTITNDVIDGSSGNAKIGFTMTVPVRQFIRIISLTSKIVLENATK